MPYVTIKTGFHTPEGEEEVLTEYLCDWPECPNFAVHPLGCIPDIRVMAIVCEAHTRRRTATPDGSGAQGDS